MRQDRPVDVGSLITSFYCSCRVLLPTALLARIVFSNKSLLEQLQVSFC